MKTNMRKLIVWFLVLILISADALTIAEDLATMMLPTTLKTIEAEAFCGDTSIEKVVVPEGVTEIGSRAFANSSVEGVELPESLESISEDVFEGVTDVTVFAPEDSYAYNWAVMHGYMSTEYTPEESFTYTMDAGEATITGYTGSNAIVNIPLTIQNNPVTGIEDNAFQGNTLITKVILPNALRRIGSYSFAECSNLKHYG